MDLLAMADLMCADNCQAHGINCLTGARLPRPGDICTGKRAKLLGANQGYFLPSTTAGSFLVMLGFANTAPDDPESVAAPTVPPGWSHAGVSATPGLVPIDVMWLANGPAGLGQQSVEAFDLPRMFCLEFQVAGKQVVPNVRKDNVRSVTTPGSRQSESAIDALVQLTPVRTTCPLNISVIAIGYQGRILQNDFTGPFQGPFPGDIYYNDDDTTGLNTIWNWSQGGPALGGTRSAYVAYEAEEDVPKQLSWRITQGVTGGSVVLEYFNTISVSFGIV